MRKLLAITLLSGLLGLTQVSQAISHIGGRVRSDESLFKSDFGAGPYMVATDLAQSLRLIYGPLLGSISGKDFNFLIISELSTAWPEFLVENKEEAMWKLENLGWRIVKNEPESCLLVMRFLKDKTANYVYLWGYQRGVVVTFPWVKPYYDLQQNFDKNLELLPGACAWN